MSQNWKTLLVFSRHSPNMVHAWSQHPVRSQSHISKHTCLKKKKPSVLKDPIGQHHRLQLFYVKPQWCSWRKQAIRIWSVANSPGVNSDCWNMWNFSKCLWICINKWASQGQTGHLEYREFSRCGAWQMDRYNAKQSYIIEEKKFFGFD